MSTTEDQIALLNREKQENIEAIELLTKQIGDLNTAISNVNNNIAQYNVQIDLFTNQITTLTADNIVIDDIILALGN